MKFLFINDMPGENILYANNAYVKFKVDILHKHVHMSMCVLPDI